MAYASSKDSDQPGHLPSLIRVFAVRMKKDWVLSYPLSAQRRLWSDWVDAQADLLLGAQSFCWFCHEVAHIALDLLPKSNKMACEHSEDSDQPGHPPSLIRVFAVCMKKAWVLSYPLSTQQRLWSDWADAQADMSLRWAHSHFVGFVMRRLILLWIFFQNHMTGRGSSIGSASAWHASGPRVRSPHPAHSFLEIWSWETFYRHSPSSADSRRTVVSYWRTNVH